MSKHSFLMSIIWAATYAVSAEDKSSLCALMAILFALFYVANKK